MEDIDLCFYFLNFLSIGIVCMPILNIIFKINIKTIIFVYLAILFIFYSIHFIQNLPYKKFCYDNCGTSFETYVKNKLHGESCRFYKNGSIKSKFNYKNDKKDGKCTKYYENGNIKYDFTYECGRIYNTCFHYSINKDIFKFVYMYNYSYEISNNKISKHVKFFSVDHYKKKYIDQYTRINNDGSLYSKSCVKYGKGIAQHFQNKSFRFTEYYKNGYSKMFICIVIANNIVFMMKYYKNRYSKSKYKNKKFFFY